MLHTLRRRAGEEQGFTLIELLVVILIIGILAAIAIPSFIGQKNKANDAQAKSYARTAQTAMETCYTDQQTYVGCDTKLTDIEPTLNNAQGLSVTGASANGYTVTVTAPSTNDTFSIKRNPDGTVQRSCTQAAGVKSSGCNGGTW